MGGGGGGGREREQGAELECRPPCTPVAAKGGKPGLQYDTYVMFEEMLKHGEKLTAAQDKLFEKLKKIGWNEIAKV